MHRWVILNYRLGSRCHTAVIPLSVGNGRITFGLPVTTAILFSSNTCSEFSAKSYIMRFVSVLSRHTRGSRVRPPRSTPLPLRRSKNDAQTISALPSSARTRGYNALGNSKSLFSHRIRYGNVAIKLKTREICFVNYSKQYNVRGCQCRRDAVLAHV
jgi:hypothetical protein